GAVERIGDPRRTTAVHRAVRLVPRVGAGFVTRRCEVEAPDLRAVLDLEGHHSTTDTPVAAGLGYVHEAGPHDRRRTDAFTDRPVSDLARPKDGTAFRVERIQEAILRSADHAAAGDGNALVGGVHLRALRYVLMSPPLLAGRRVDRVSPQMRRRVQDAVVD